MSSDNTTKVPTTYAGVRAGDEIDGITIIATDQARDAETQERLPLFALQFADTLAWGPWTPDTTPVSVQRLTFSL